MLAAMANMFVEGPPEAPRKGLAARAGLASLIFLAHLVVVAMVLIVIWIAWRVGYPMWSDETNPLLFDRFPPHYLFDTMDAFVIFTFLGYGIIDAVRTFRS